MDAELCFGQRIDPELGVLEPWYTNPCMDRIKQLELSDKIVMEYGGGASTVWWCKKAKYVYTVDHNAEWWVAIDKMLRENGVVEKSTNTYIPTHEGDQTDTRDAYVKPEFLNGVKVDIAIVDGVHRYECAEYAVKVLKPEILIIDNHQQDFVFICPALDFLLDGVKMERFIQPDHTDHEGRPWATAIFFLNEKSCKKY